PRLLLPSLHPCWRLRAHLRLPNLVAPHLPPPRQVAELRRRDVPGPPRRFRGRFQLAESEPEIHERSFVVWTGHSPVQAGRCPMRERRAEPKRAGYPSPGSRSTLEARRVDAQSKATSHPGAGVSRATSPPATANMSTTATGANPPSLSTYTPSAVPN